MTSLQFDLLSPRWQADVGNRPIKPIPYTDPFLASIQDLLDAAGDNPVPLDEWDYEKRGAVGMDVEVFRNFFVVCFKRFVDGSRVAFERSAGVDFNKDDVLRILFANTIITFNGLSYDAIILTLALSGASCWDLKQASDRIIFGQRKQWELERELGVRVPHFDHIDLIEPNPSVRQGLKAIHGRLHGRYMVDLPFDPEAVLTRRQMNVATLYCQNDLDATQSLYQALREPLNLRVSLGKRYGLDLRSKSDAQVGEAIVRRRVEAVAGHRIGKPENVGISRFGYEPPKFLKFEAKTLTDLLDQLSHTRFEITSSGKISTPAVLEGLIIRLGQGAYAMGIGGLHSTESHRALFSDEQSYLQDVDVASQYPNIIRNLGLYPPALGPAFLDVYSSLIKERLAAKAFGDKVMADGGRIALNGVYGKLGSSYSILYAPHLLIAVTLTGQLSILMLIERAEAAGIPVVSANTDGVVFHCPRLRTHVLDMVLKEWEADTGFATERTPYRALYSSSVNTYMAIKEDGKVKRKGPISDPWSDEDIRGQIMKNPQMTVLSEAAVKYLRDGQDIERTVRSTTDPRKFLTVVNVTSGAYWRGHSLGRIARYYWCLDGEPIMTKSRGKVSKTEGARPLQELTNELPPAIDYLKYCEEAVKLIVDLGGKV